MNQTLWTRWLNSRTRYRLFCLRRAAQYPFVAPVYRAVFKMTPRFGAYVRGRDSVAARSQGDTEEDK